MEQMNISATSHHVGSTERVFVAHVNDLNDFYLHPGSVHDSLIKLGQDLFNEYSQSFNKTLRSNNDKLNVGDYCACPSESEDWYRGLIRQLDSNGLATVFKLDYGDIQIIPIQFLRPLQKHFFQPQRLAFHCSLANLIRPIDGWPLEIIQEFCSRLTTTFLYARFINYNEIRDIAEVEITEKSSKIPLNKDFEQYQEQRSTLELNDKFIYKYIPMEKLESNQIYQIRLLYYISPSRFYVYLPEKTNSHISFQTDLQNAIKNLCQIQSPIKYQPVAVQDNHAIWHRAIIRDFTSDPSKFCIYFIDIGQIDYISINNIRKLPEEFQRKPAFAIPCCLYNVCPLNVNEQPIWKSNDQVHEEFNRFMVNNVTCQVYGKQIQLYYEVQIDIPKIGDLGSFLCENNLISRPRMQRSQRPTLSSNQSLQSFVRAQVQPSGIPPSRQQYHQSITQPNEYSNNMPQEQQQQLTRMINPASQNPTMQQLSNISTMNKSSSNIPVIPPQDGVYTIIQVRSAAEFYGVSQNRQMELDNLFKHLTDYYNNFPNDQSLNVNFFMVGDAYVILEGDKYHRVVLKRRESESRVSVKLVDRGDEIFVDTSELLQINDKYTTIPAFAQPFRLHGYDESQNSTNVTINLKKLILNQRVYISQCLSPIHGFYPVEVTINGNQSVNKILFSNEKNLSITPPSSTNRSTFPQPPPTHIESQIFNNSSRYHHSNMNQDMTGRLDIGQRTNDVLPAPQKILTGPPRNQPGRFGGPTNPNPSSSSSSNEPTTRFSSFSNRNQQQTQSTDSTSTNSIWNKEQNNKPNVSNNNFERQQTGSSQLSMNQRIDENKNSLSNNQQQPSFEQTRSFGSRYSHDDHNERETSENNNRTYNGGFQRGSAIHRGGTSGYNDRGLGERNMVRNNEEKNENTQSSGGFSKRGGSYGDRGGRGNSFQDRNGSNRNRGDDNSGNYMQRSQNFDSNRGGFRGGRNISGGFGNRRDQGENGDFGRRGSRGGTRGNFNPNRGNYRDHNDVGLHLTKDNDNSSKTFSGWPSTRSISINFEAGDQFLDHEIPKNTFKFVVSHVEKFNDFFIQLLSKGDELTKLSEILQNEYKQSPEININSLKENQACLAKSSFDNCWYRAIVLATNINKTKIRFIDFGDTTDVNSNTIRQIAKKYCSTSPYAYRCTFENSQMIENVNIDNFINKCIGKEFHGKIQRKTSDGKFLLESDDLFKLLLDINTNKLKSEITLKRIKCVICHIETKQHEFYIQDDEETLNKIVNLIDTEKLTNPILTIDEIKHLQPNTKFIAIYEDEFYRGIIIQSNESDENVDICFIDYGNTSSCPKSSLKRCSEQLSLYPAQAKHCRLYGITIDQLDNAYQDLSENSDSDNHIEISIINNKDQILDVLVFINDKCLNEKFGYNQSNIILEQENIIEDKILTKYRQGFLTHVEKTKPYVYLQLIPESKPILEQIDQLIKTIIEENKHNLSYEIGEYVIAKFSEDDNYYRARIESYSSTTQFYTVYFLDYGNIDENVTFDNIYSYSDNLQEISPQAHGYLLEKINLNIWEDSIRSLVEDRINDEVEFYYTDDNHSIIHLKFDNENDIYNLPNEEIKKFQANISATNKDCFYIQILSDEYLHINEIENILQNSDKQHQETWNINDLCLVSNEENRYYRGKILTINENKYDIQCIDYGNILQNITNDHLYILPNEDIYKKSSIARQCRLYGINDINQTKAIEEIIKYIPITEHVTIIIENNQHDSCLLVTLIRENNENINEKYSIEHHQTIENENKQQSDNDEKQEIIEENSSESVNTNEQLPSSTDVLNTNEQLPSSTDVLNTNKQLPSSTDVLNANEQLPSSTDVLNTDENNSLLSATNNQTIDFGENDPSTTIKDDTNTSIQSN